MWSATDAAPAVTHPSHRSAAATRGARARRAASRSTGGRRACADPARLALPRTTELRHKYRHLGPSLTARLQALLGPPAADQLSRQDVRRLRRGRGDERLDGPGRAAEHAGDLVDRLAALAPGADHPGRPHG